MNLMSLLNETGVIAKLVLMVLFLASIACWSIIYNKWQRLKTARIQNASFNAVFWKSKNIEEIVSKSEKFSASPLAIVFRAGVRELRRFASNDSGTLISNKEKMESIERALFRTSNEQISSLEKDLSWLATTASAAPFVGLFGTVLGIMNAFHSIASTGAANLAVVAPGISEALITTATGIGAAIPAVIAYNYFIGEIKKVATDIEYFSQDFISIIHRGTNSSRKGNA